MEIFSLFIPKPKSQVSVLMTVGHLVIVLENLGVLLILKTENFLITFQKIHLVSYQRQKIYYHGCRVNRHISVVVPFVLCFGVEFLCCLNLMYVFIS